MAILMNSAGSPTYPVRGAMSVHETTLTAALSPLVINVNSDLNIGATARGNRGWFKVDGTADIKVEVAQTGTVYMTQFTIKSGEILDLTGLNINAVRLTRTTADSAFRFVAW